MGREYTVIIERDDEGFYIADVPELRGCHTQAKSLDELMERTREAILLCIEDQDDADTGTHLVGVQKIAV
jgi:predicted RNase H-like HicB family nuclease